MLPILLTYCCFITVTIAVTTNSIIDLSHPLASLILRPTSPQLNLPLKFQSSATTTTRTRWSCFADSMQKDSWRVTTCHFKHACYDRTQHDFVVFVDDQDQDQPPPPDVSLGVFNYKWFTKYDAIYRIKLRVERTKIPPHYLLPDKELWVPHLPFAPSNIGHLIWDDYLSWFNAAWNVLPSSHNEYALRPLWLNPNNPPWATCDWIREHEGPGHSLGSGFSNRCLSNNKKWLGTMLGTGNVLQPEAKIGTGERIGPKSSAWLDGQSLPDSSLVCFPDMVLGLGTLSNQGTGLHGWNVDDTVPACAGRGPLFWEFRTHMMRMMNAPDAAPGKSDKMLIFFSERSSDRVSVNWETHMKLVHERIPEFERMVEKIVGRSIKLVVESNILASLSPADQASLAARSAIFVTVAGGGALTAQFLSRGAALIIYHENQEQIHDGFVDWKVWNFLTSWARSNWIINKMAYDMTVFERVLREEVLLCARFWVPMVGEE